MENRLLRALAVLRSVLLLNSWVVGLLVLDEARHPGGVLGVLGAMSLWTAFATWAYAAPRRRGPVLLGLDLTVTVAALGLSPLLQGPGWTATVPGFWVMSALLAWSVHLRWAGGLAAGLVLAGVDLALRDSVGLTAYGNAFLLVVGGPVVGYLTGSLQQLAEERDVAERAAATAAERARLARVVHDGVLQVLALVQRRSQDLGQDGAELGRLAGEQERGLRQLILAQDTATPDGHRAGGPPAPEADLAALLAQVGIGPGVEVVTPGTPVRLPTATAHELAAVVLACLDNVERHVGQGAAVWVLLEDLGDAVRVGVRDDGPGIAEGRLEEAAAQGRLGVRESIRGRIGDLGGTATLDTGRHGTEWRFVLPRESP